VLPNKKHRIKNIGKDFARRRDHAQEGERNYLKRARIIAIFDFGKPRKGQKKNRKQFGVKRGKKKLTYTETNELN